MDTAGAIALALGVAGMVGLPLGAWVYRLRQEKAAGLKRIAELTKPEPAYLPLAERWRIVFTEGGDMRRAWESLTGLRGKAQFMDGADCRGEKP